MTYLCKPFLNGRCAILHLVYLISLLLGAGNIALRDGLSTGPTELNTRIGWRVLSAEQPIGRRSSALCGIVATVGKTTRL